MSQNKEKILQTNPDIIYSLNASGEFIEINSAVENVLGYPVSELIGKSVFGFIHDDDVDRVRQSFVESVRSGDTSVKTIAFRMWGKDGQTVDVEVNRRLILEDGQVIRQDGIARDISERVRLQDALQEKSRELERRVEERTERLAYTTRQLAALNAVSNRFNLIYTEEELLEEAPRLLCDSLDFDRCTIIMMEDGELVLKAFNLDKDTPELQQKFMDRVKSKTQVSPPHFFRSFENNETVFVPDLNADPDWPREPGETIRTKAVVISPIKVNKKPIGILVGNMQHHTRDMDRQDVARFEMFANMIGLSLTNIRSYQELETKVIERTRALRQANSKLRKKAKESQQTSYSLGKANVDLLAAQESLQSKNAEMKKLLAELTESEEALKLYKEIFTNSTDAILVLDSDGRFIMANPSFLRINGYTQEELIGKTPAIIVGKVGFSEVGKSLMKTGMYRGELKATPKEGPVRDVELTAFTIYKENSEILCRVGFARDITQRKQAEEKLAGRLRYEAGLAGCSRTLLEGRDNKDALNTALKYLLDAADAGRVYIFQNFDDPDDGLCMRQTHEVCAQNVEPEIDNELLQHAPYKEGFMRWQKILSAGEPVKGLLNTLPESERAILESQGIQSILVLPLTVANSWYGFIGFDDLTRERDWNEEDVRLLQTAAEMIGGYIEHLEAETALQKSLKDLADANLELRETQGQLVQSEKMASLGMLVAGIAHEINTPIGAVHSMHDTLKRAVAKLQQTLESQYPDELQNNRGLFAPLKIIEDANKVISTGSERVADIVRRLRSFARLDEAELKTIDIHEGLEDTLALIHHEVKHHIVIEKKYGNIPPLPCYPGRLNQVFLNLLNNSRQAIKEKGQITITTYDKGDYIYVEISDDGVGIPEETLSKIFDPGFTTKGVGVGTGLGLSIVYQIIQEHMGNIDVESEPGKGTTFKLMLRKNLDKLLEEAEQSPSK